MKKFPKKIYVSIEGEDNEAYLNVIEDPSAGVWLAQREHGALAGFVVAAGCKLPIENREATAGEIRQLYVLPRYQNAKLGSRLLETALDWLAEQKRSPVYIGVWSKNYGAQRFYGRYGFVKVGDYQFRVGKTVDHEFILKR